MLEELHIASNLLHVALERYISACSALKNSYSLKNNIKSALELSDSVHNELNLVKAYKGKLTQAEVAVQGARNNLASVPVSTLPPEVLTHIFHLALAQQPCPLRVPCRWDSGDPVRFPPYPDLFTHVCSRWRQVALASRKLWSHIDIHLSCHLSKGFHTRAGTYVARAQQAPLDIHFIDTSRNRRNRGTARLGKYDVDFKFLAASPWHPIRSLGLLVREQYHTIHSGALEYCLANGLPISLSELVINVPREGFSNPSFFETSPDPISSTHFSSLLTEQQLENAWCSTTALSLKGRYPRWSSAAYHGLIDLRLLGGYDISKLDLAGILTSSPELRILHCDFNVYDLPPLSALASPLVLHELEVLNLEGMNEVNTERFLGCLKPGPRPLRLSFCGNPTSALLKYFFARSNVQEMRIVRRLQLFASGGTSSVPASVFFLPPQLKTLVMDGWGHGISHRLGTTSISPGSRNDTHLTKLDILYMISCRYDSFTEFHDVVANYSPQRLLLWKCGIKQSTLHMTRITMSYLESVLGNHLSQFCPSIECPTSVNFNTFPDWVGLVP